MQATSTTPETLEVPSFKVTVRSHEQSLQLTVNSETSIRLALDETALRVRAACGGLGSCGACLIKIVNGQYNPPTLAEHQKLLPMDLADGVRLACQLRARSDCELLLENPAPTSVWKSLDNRQLYKPATGNSSITQKVYAVAVDLGTTYIRLSLWDRQSGRRLGMRYGLNPQIADGADVLTRLDAGRLDAQTGRRIAEQARSAIIQGIRDILSRDYGEVSPILCQLGRVLIVGNTAMLTLICGDNVNTLYQPENWESAIPCQPLDPDEWRHAWHTPYASIDIVQPLAGFIGSDLLADVLATGISKNHSPALLLDFGTNTEIALWDGQRLWATSVPGGPAFEGVGMRNGMPAEAGAICSVKHDAGQWFLQTIGDSPARGFCTSGFIDAVAALLDAKLLKMSGRFSTPNASHAYCLEPDNPHSAIFAADIDIFQRAKASTAAALAQLMITTGVQLSDLDSLWVCGNLGQQLNLASAFRVGLLPTMPDERIHVLGNASLEGCEQILLEMDAEPRLNTLVTNAKVVNFGGVEDYETRFIDHLCLKPLPNLE